MRELFERGFLVGSMCLAVCLSAGAIQATAQQDQGPPQYPQQSTPDQGQPQNSQQDQGPSQYPQQSTQDQPTPDQGQSQNSQQDQGPPQYPGQPQQDQGANTQVAQVPGQQTGPSSSAAQGPSQSPDSVARISFVQGDVKVMSGGRTDFQQAIANMPLTANTTVQTGQDGQAEVEFTDGSVARLTPNSSLEAAHLGQDYMQIQQNSGLAYYELNVGQGHPPFRVELPNAEVTPTANAIFRINLDNVPEVAVTTGAIEVAGSGIADTTVSENQSMRFQAGNGQSYTIAQSVTPDSWDQWNHDRDQAISQEADQQTSARNQAGSANDENWNDLDAYGNWYPVAGTGNVWVPAGVSAGWDPYGYGYWGFYPGVGGYTWISGYPWGWLPYHCGLWSYYSFGWGWMPGGCGAHWFPVAAFRGYPGYFIPIRPVWRAGFAAPVNRLFIVDRGPQARGPWGAGHPMPFVNHQAVLNVGGHAIAPLARTSFHEQAFAGNRGTAPGARAALSSPGNSSGQGIRPAQSFDGQGYQGSRLPAQTQYQSSQAARSAYTPRSAPTPHYSAPPPAPHYSPPPRSSSSGGSAGRR
jgi:hypothetical protein